MGPAIWFTLWLNAGKRQAGNHRGKTRCAQKVAVTMKLKEFRVREFRSVWDSGPVKVDGQVTCLVGKNEAGKTLYAELENMG